jgi:(1->4)-alpha-D-glucan 1-alpha-D-glucosylmutase
VAFTRSGGLAVLVPRLTGADEAGDWAGTTVELPAGPWTDVLTGQPVNGGQADVAALLRRFPVAILGKA